MASLPANTVKIKPFQRAPNSGQRSVQNYVHKLELDRYGMQTGRLAAKLANYRELYRRQVRNDHPAAGTDDIPKTVPMWKQMYPGHRREGYPPLAIVFTGRADSPVSEQALRNRLATIGEECARCSDARAERARRESGWDGWGENPAVAKAAAAKVAEDAALLEFEAAEFRRQKEDDSLRGFVRALGFRRAPKS